MMNQQEVRAELRANNCMKQTGALLGCGIIGVGIYLIVEYSKPDGSVLNLPFGIAAIIAGLCMVMTLSGSTVTARNPLEAPLNRRYPIPGYVGTNLNGTQAIQTQSRENMVAVNIN
jgi:FtsH-binding integral membrane protein